jgi:2-oxoglutarate ferredoxin oxidoreductase subunit alpha
MPTAYRLTYEAFNIAEQFRTPVIVLSSKDIALTRQTVDLSLVELPPLVERERAPDTSPYQPYAVDSPADVPGFAPIGGRQRVRFTGSIHDEDGVLTIDRDKIDRKLTHLREKIAVHQTDFERADANLDPSADTLIVSYGTADGAAREAVDSLRSAGVAVSHLTLFSLWPVPTAALREAVTPPVRRIVMPELNIGLYAEELRRALPGVTVESILRFDGGLIHPRTIVERVRDGAGP